YVYSPQGVKNEKFESTARAHEPARRGFAESGGGDVFKPGHQPTVSWNRAKRVETTQPIYRVVQWGNRGCQSLGDYAPVFAGGLQHVAAGFPAFRQHWSGSVLSDLCGRHWRQYPASAGRSHNYFHASTLGREDRPGERYRRAGYPLLVRHKSSGPCRVRVHVLLRITCTEVARRF